jgi:hypothetical protein
MSEKVEYVVQKDYVIGWFYEKKFPSLKMAKRHISKLSPKFKRRIIKRTIREEVVE